MKILFLSKFFYPHLGGVEKHVERLALELIKAGHEVNILTWVYKKNLKKHQVYKGINIFRLDIIDESSKLGVWSKILTYKNIFSDADVVHVHDVFWWILPIYFSFRKKIFLTYHGYETKYPIAFKAKIQRYIFSKLSKAVIHVGSYIQNFYFDKPNLVTFGGVKKNSKEITEIISYRKKITITFLGRMEHDTDFLEFVNFVKKINNSDLKIQVYFVGDGSMIKNAENLGTTTGFIKNVSEYLQKSDFVFATSYLSILEAQSFGKIVLATYSNLLKKEYLESFPNSSSMLIAKNHESLLTKFNLLLSNPSLISEMQNNAFVNANEMTWKKLSDEYQKLWLEFK